MDAVPLEILSCPVFLVEVPVDISLMASLTMAGDVAFIFGEDIVGDDNNKKENKKSGLSFLFMSKN
jgi:hypothetical protein